MRHAMVEDGVAMCEFYAWFEAALADPSRREPITELTIDEKLTEARARRPGYVGPSFATIAAFNANGAMPHYRATPESHATIDGDGLLLIDSGAQYLGGTTDITRMWPIGRISEAQRRDVTTRAARHDGAQPRRASRAARPGRCSTRSRARRSGQHGLDYGHGTGHGVGYFLNVHEGPQTISRAVAEPAMAMEPGMITSIEPGVYRPGPVGRAGREPGAERARRRASASEFGEFLEFETLTLCPIDTRCIDRIAAAPRRDRLAQRLPRDGRGAPRAAASTAPRSAWLRLRTTPI